MDHTELLPHLFRTEYSKIISVLCKRYGFYQIEIAEDIVSDTFLTASQTWGINGIPKNPVGWLYTVAKNKAKNVIHRDTLLQNKLISINKEENHTFEGDLDLSNENILDSQLRMLFAISHPSIPLESQIALSLRVLCGFGLEEIANAFLTNKETISKRLFRAKEKLREFNVKLDFPSSNEWENRFTSVLRTIYLLFNEGYASKTPNKMLKKDLCLEAISLCSLLLENQETNTSEVNALISLFCFHISRFDARIDGNDEIVLYEDQNRELWNLEFIRKGEAFFSEANKEPKFSKYHLEAAIAYWHTFPDKTERKWDMVHQLYSGLLQIEPSPLVQLNLIYAIYRKGNREDALMKLKKFPIADNANYFCLLGELYIGEDSGKAKEAFERAYNLAKTDAEKLVIYKRISRI